MIDNRTSGQAVKGVRTILNELKADGKIENYGDIDGDVAVTGIQFDVNSLTLEVGDNSGTLTATFLPENSAGGYYVEVKGKKYPVSKVNEKIEIGTTEITTEGSSNRKINNVSTTNSSVATVEKVGEDGIRINGVAAGTATITVKYSENIKTILEVAVCNFVTVIVQSNDMNKGTVSLSPSSINNKYAEGSVINLTATENSGYYFEGWYNGTTKLSESSSYNYTARSSDITIEARFLKYGKTVNLGIVTANNVTMASGWKYFLEDSDNIYLMYGDYLENAQIPAGTNISKSGYDVKTTSNGDDLVNYLKGETAIYSSTWNTINEAVKVAVKARLIASGATESNATTAVANITTKGAPTPEQWMSSYNENYGTKLGAEYFSSTGQEYYEGSKGTSTDVALSPKEGGTSATGYLYTRDTTTNPVKYENILRGDFMATTVGYPSGSSNMYYPHISTISALSATTSGYWLARLFG